MAKELLKSYSLNFFSLGQNTVQTANSDIFQVPNPDSLFPQEGIPQLTEAVNVNIDNYGTPKRRDGLTDKLTLTATFEDQNWNEVIDELCLIFGFSYSDENGVITLTISD